MQKLKEKKKKKGTRLEIFKEIRGDIAFNLHSSLEF